MSLCSSEELERYNEEKIQKLKDESERFGKIADELDVDKLVSKTLENGDRSYHVCPCESECFIYE